MYEWHVYRAEEYSEVVGDNYLGVVVTGALEEDALPLASLKYGLDVWSLWVLRGQAVHPDDIPDVETIPQMEVVRVGKENKKGSPLAQESTRVLGRLAANLKHIGHLALYHGVKQAPRTHFKAL